MTVEEIKQNYSMADVIGMYGLHADRKGFCKCPFHQHDTHPSMKVYSKDYHCYTCNENGDIFTFVQKMENCSFKEAFLKLGGTYETKTSWQRKKFEYELQKKKEKEERELNRKKQMKREILKDIKFQKLFTSLFAPLSDDWCDAMNRLEYDLYILEQLNNEGVNLYD